MGSLGQQVCSVFLPAAPVSCVEYLPNECKMSRFHEHSD